MQVSLEKISPVEHRLTIIVPAEELNIAYDKRLQEVLKRANVRGFRRGKVPLAVVKKQFGSDILSEALTTVIRNTLPNAIAEHNLQSIVPPRIDVKVAKLSEPVEYTAIVEVLPVIESVNLQLDQIEKMVVNVTDTDVDQVVQQVRKQFKAENMPEEDDQALATLLGIEAGDPDKMRKDIKMMMERERDRIVQNHYKEQVVKAMLEQNTLDIPPTLLLQEAGRMHDMMYHNRQHDHSAHSQQEMAVFAGLAKNRLSVSLLLAAFAKQHEIKVDQGRVEARIKEHASLYDESEEAIKWLSQDKQRKDIEEQVWEDQIIEQAIAGVPVTEKVVSYAELKGFLQQKAPEKIESQDENK